MPESPEQAGGSAAGDAALAVETASVSSVRRSAAGRFGAAVERNGVSIALIGVVGVVLVIAFNAMIGQIESVHERIGDTNARIDEVNRTINARIDEVNRSINARIDDVDRSINARIDDTNARIEEVNRSINARIDEMNRSINARIDETNDRITRLEMRVERLENKVDALDDKVDGIDLKLTALIAALGKSDEVEAALAGEVQADPGGDG